MNHTPVTAADLQIAGLVPLSTLDWPGKLAAVVFTQGCPWDCGYCQNPELRDPAMPGLVEWSDVTALLSRRTGLLDGVVFSGGEATRQAALLPAIEEARAMGFAIGLHTAGAYPTALTRVLDQLDWVGIDIKALPADYGEVVGVDVGGVKAWQSLDLLMEEVARRRGASAAPLQVEVRLTVHSGSPQARDAIEIARQVHVRGVTHFALQNARLDGTSEQFRERASEWDLDLWKIEFGDIAANIEALGWERFEAR